MSKESMEAIFGELVTADALCFERAKRLLLALATNHEYTLLEIRRRNHSSIGTCESLIVEIRVDAVPPKNIQGIRYPEQLALLVPNDETALVEVYALRPDFPKHLRHQTSYDLVSQICLTSDTIESVLRQWTPQSFLRRISWWFAKTATNEIHPDDQPLEILFHKANYELVLPWNFEQIRNDPNTKFLFASHGPRGLEQTFSLITSGEVDAEQVQEGPALGIYFLDVVVPTIVHKSPIFFRNTLGEISDQFQEIGIDIIGGIRAALASKVTAEGVSQDKGSKKTVILLEVPIKRDVESEIPEKIIKRPFFVSCDWLALGEQLGVFISHKDGKSTKYYLDAFSAVQSSNEWRQIHSSQMEFKQQLTPENCRAYSGVNDVGPAGVLIGVGALGSKLLELWVRNGWGRWTVIDHDHIKPHNLSRHTAGRYDIGNYKVTAAAEAVENIFNGAATVTPIVADVVTAPHSTYACHVEPAQLVIDATTTLDYPRKVSNIDTFPRHASVFLTPNGNSSVLMLESDDRKVRLRTLEAQYYRALIHSEWGDNHLGAPSGTFQSGASCRDISLMMPYSKIIAHAATLSEQLQIHSAAAEAKLRLWERTADGQVTVYDIPVYEDRLACSGTLQVYIDAGLEQKLNDMRTQAFPNETGGILVGYFDFTQKIAIIVDALPAPPDSISTPRSFQRGVAGIAESLTGIKTKTIDNVDYIGEWHTHPENHSAQPSSLDIHQLGGLALSMAVDGLPVLSLIVGEPNINVLIASLQDA